MGTLASFEVATTSNIINMATTCPVLKDFIFTEHTFGKCKEDFVWFIKKAVSDRKSDAYTELFQRLLKMFVDFDTNRDGLVSKASFFMMITAYEDPSLFATDEEKEDNLEKLFNSMDLKYTGVITFDEWLKFCMEHIGSKVATMEAHPILDHGDKEQFLAYVRKAVVPECPEHTELYWYLLEAFVEHDANKDGNVTEYAFATMVDKVLALPLKLGLVKTNVEKYGEEDKVTEARKEQFKKYNTRGDGKLSFDEFLAYCMEQIFKKMLE